MASDSPRAADGRCCRGTRRLALVGLAKNTGKTETLAAILAEHAAAGRPVGVTSIGRDGEAHDVIDARIDKPRAAPRGGQPRGDHRRTAARERRRARAAAAQTGVRTPLGEVVVARLSEQGTVEVAGPSAAADVRAVSEAMVELGAEQVLIDGAIDRRAASSPAVADGLRDGHRRRARRGHRAGGGGAPATRSSWSGCPGPPTAAATGASGERAAIELRASGSS